MISGQHETSAERIPLGVKVAYGGAEWSSSLVFTAIGIFFLPFLTDAVGISPSIGGSILFAAVMWDAVTDPAMGVISDRTRGRYGRRRPYLIAAAIPFGITFWMLFSSPSLDGNALVIYYLAMALLMHTAITLVDVPYTALAPEMTKDYDERTSLVSYRVVWSQIGSIVGGAVPLLIVERFSEPKAGWSAMGAILGAACIFPILLTWHFTRGWERYAEDTESLKFRDMLDALVGNRSFRYVAGIYLFSITTVYIISAMAVYFLEYYIGLSGKQISGFLLFFFVCTVLWVPVITFASNRLGKRNAFILFMALWALAYGIGNLVVKPGQMLAVYLISVLGAAGAGSTYQLCWAMIPDVVEVDEFKTGRRREGLYYGVAILILKAGSAFALLIVGHVLERIGYVPGVAQPPAVLLGLRIMFGPLVAGLLIISIILAYFLPMTRNRHRALLEAIRAKKAGDEWSEEGFRELL
jgi:GPH family glycoside/pentoside/hexuronide:cation symporter